jgi:hypothetical protein
MLEHLGVIRSKSCPVISAADLLSAIAPEQKLCDQLIDASNIQLQAATRNPSADELEALDRICDAIAQSTRLIETLNVRLLELQLANSAVEIPLRQVA